ncbi:MAG: hypothetical protein L0J78_06055 [Lactococcus lactis]|nr:hypothetical protein [Lactococcus lactis]
MLQDSCQFNATTGSIEVVDRKIADEIHVSSMRPRGALKLGIEKIADKIHVSSMRLRRALKL